MAGPGEQPGQADQQMVGVRPRDPGEDQRGPERGDASQVAGQPIEDRSLLRIIHIAGRQIVLSQAEDGQAELSRQGGVGQKVLLETATHAAVQFAGVDAVVRGDRLDAQPDRGRSLS